MDSPSLPPRRGSTPRSRMVGARAALFSVPAPLFNLLAGSPAAPKKHGAAGNVYLPHPQLCPWVNDLIEECAAFPNGAHDDQVDAMTQALLRWKMAPYQQVIYYPELPEISPI